MNPLFLRVWHEERGGTALTLTWFMVAALLFAVGLYALLGVYITHQQLRTAAIAAAHAANRAITDEVVLPPAIEEEAARRVAAVEDRAERILDRWDCDEDDDSCSPLTKADKIRAYRIAFEDLYGDSLDRNMAEKMVEGTWENESTAVKMNELIPDDHDLACLIRDAAEDHKDFIRSAAERLAQANDAQLEKLTVLDEDGWSLVLVSKEVKPFGADWLFPNGGYPRLTVGHMARIRTLGGARTPEWSSSC